MYADLVKCLLSSPSAKAIVVLMQSSSDKEFKNRSVLSRIVTECTNRLRTATSTDKGVGVNPFLALPTLMRAVVHIGRFSCDSNTRCGDGDTLERLWQEVLSLHDNVARASSPLPHLVLSTLEALIWLTQCVTDADSVTDDRDDGGYQWLAVQDRVHRAIPTLRLSDGPVLAATLVNCIMDRARQSEGTSSVPREAVNATEGDLSVQHHSKASLKLLLSAGEFLVHTYPTTETVLQLDRIWAFIALFTICPGGDAVTAGSYDKVTKGPPLVTSAAPTDPLSPSYFLDLKDLVGPPSPTPNHAAKKHIDARTPERAVHTFLRRSLLMALDGQTAVPSVGQNKNKAKEHSAVLLLSQHALWHLAEHVRTATLITASLTSTVLF